MMNLEDLPVEKHDAERRRAAILRCLYDAQQNEASDLILAHAVRALGARYLPDLMAESIGWLEARQLVMVERTDFAKIVRITPSGKMIARGEVDAPGILPARNLTDELPR